MKVLFVSYAFPPISSPGAMRIFHFCEDLIDLGHHVTVVTARDGYSSMIDSNLDEGRAKVIRTKDLVSKSSFTGHYQGSGKKKGSLVGRLASLIYPDRDVTWLPTALFNSEIKGMDFDCVIGSYPNKTNLLLAKLLARRHKAKLVLDMRDLWTEEFREESSLTARNKLDLKLEEWLFKNSDVILTVSSVNTSILRKRLCKNKRIYTIRNGFDLRLISDVRDKVPEPIVSDKFSVAYAGSFYGGERDPRDLLKAISKMSINGDINESNFSLDLYGPKEEIIRTWVDELEVSHLVEFKGSLPQAKLFEILLSSNVLLTITRNHQISSGEMTTKVFEYIGLGSDILCICNEGYEIEKVLNEVEQAEVSYFGNVDSIQTYLKRKFDDWFASNKKINRASLSDEFSRKQAARDLSCLLEEL